MRTRRCAVASLRLSRPPPDSSAAARELGETAARQLESLSIVGSKYSYDTAKRPSAVDTAAELGRALRGAGEAATLRSLQVHFCTVGKQGVCAEAEGAPRPPAAAGSLLIEALRPAVFSLTCQQTAPRAARRGRGAGKGAAGGLVPARIHRFPWRWRGHRGLCVCLQYLPSACCA